MKKVLLMAAIGFLTWSCNGAKTCPTYANAASGNSSLPVVAAR
jgi:hypothetical protein